MSEALAQEIIVAFIVKCASDAGRLRRQALLTSRQQLKTSRGTVGITPKFLRLLDQPLREGRLKDLLATSVRILVLLSLVLVGAELSEGSAHNFPVGALTFRIGDLRSDPFKRHLQKTPVVHYPVK